jgi:hypothetical protein
MKSGVDCVADQMTHAARAAVTVIVSLGVAVAFMYLADLIGLSLLARAE